MKKKMMKFNLTRLKFDYGVTAKMGHHTDYIPVMVSDNINIVNDTTKVDTKGARKLRKKHGRFTKYGRSEE